MERTGYRGDHGERFPGTYPNPESDALRALRGSPSFSVLWLLTSDVGRRRPRRITENDGDSRSTRRYVGFGVRVWFRETFSVITVGLRRSP